MAKTQSNPLAPPSPEDLEAGLPDYTASTQQGLADLYEIAHNHPVRTSPPENNEGAIGDMVLVQDETTRYIAVRYSDGWYKTANLTSV